MTKKPSGLAAFTTKDTAELEVLPEEKGRSRGQGETVALTVRIAREDWTRLHQLAMSEGVSLQKLALRGFTRELAAHGLPPMKTP